MPTLSCLHTHSTFCDGADTIQTMCQAAFDKGLSSIGFSGHAPITRKTGLVSDWHLSDERLSEYIDAVHKAARAWAGRLTVFCGLEIDYIKGLMGPADKDYADLGLDYSIGSVHYLVPPTGKPFTIDDTPQELEAGIREGFGADAPAVLEAYWAAEEELIQKGGFTILGHPDLIKKNNPGDIWYSRESPAWINGEKRIADACAQHGIISELNTGGFRHKTCQEQYPSLRFLRCLRAATVDIVINADAHCAEHLGAQYQEAQALLRSSGYRETLLFEGKGQWKRVPL
ncbi:histidinol-phosphatase [Breznakiellaceae bacterium SP9]